MNDLTIKNKYDVLSKKHPARKPFFKVSILQDILDYSSDFLS